MQENFREPPNRGEMADVHGAGRAGDSGCGAEISIFLRFDGGCVSRAAFTASGSSAVIAAGSILTGKLEGVSWRRAAALTVAEMLAEMGGSGTQVAEDARPGSPEQAAIFAVEALQAALEDSLGRGTFPVAPGAEPDTVIVAMSGGVDSSTACWLKQEQGLQVIGVTMRLWSDPEVDAADSGLSCCSPRAIRDARQVCHSLGLPHLTVDCSRPFREKVVEYFVTEYLAGRTPNPCARCNGSFRFPELMRLAERLGAAGMVTGHYARIITRDGRRMLARGRDTGKDQSYMLWGVRQPLLASMEFPLGEMRKVEVRELARRAGLDVHDRVDSQEVCFIPDDDYRRFILSQLEATGTGVPGAGEIVSVSGNRIGKHGGYINFTIGQRRGLGGGAAEPLYVVGIEPETNRVIVGDRDDLVVRALTIGGINCFLPPAEIDKVGVQLRYNSPSLPGKVVRKQGGEGEYAAEERWHIELDKPAYGVAPGQSAVLYQGDILVAGGIIISTGKEESSLPPG